MGIFGNYTGQALPNMQASQAARAAVIEQAQAIQNRLRSNIPAPQAPSFGAGIIINIYV